MAKRWTLKSQGEPALIKQLSELLNINTSIASILVQRGIDTFDKAKDFFRPSLNNMHNPFEIMDMQKAIDRIKQAIENKQSILVFGDYDVDGTTAVALVYSYFTEVYKNMFFYIPDRYAEGYGLSKLGIDYAEKNKCSLVIALDCGIKDFSEITYANEKNIDVIVCDHHQPGEELPSAYAVLNPKRLDCLYPYKELSGCGIGLKLIQAWSQLHNLHDSSWHKYLDLAAISAAADIVDMTGENRIICYYGLKQINTSPRLGIEILLKYAGYTRAEQPHNSETVFNQYIDIHKVVFTIAPRINAAGRIAHGSKAVELLIGSNIEDTDALSKNINEDNTARQALDKDICAQALDMIDHDSILKNRKSTVVFDKSWHKGVIGIVASRLIEKYYKPTIVLTQTDSIISGSARSIRNFDLYGALLQCADLLENFGGHKYAAGLSLKEENLQSFINRFEEIAQKELSDEQLIPEITIDTELDFNTITPKFYSILEQMAPFGPGNMSPVFASTNTFDTGYVKKVKDIHLSMFLGQQNSRNKFGAIAFDKGEDYDLVKTSNQFAVCYQIDLNTYNGKSSLQLKIKDINYSNRIKN